MSEAFLADELDLLATVLETEPSRVRYKSKRGMQEINEQGWIAKDGDESRNTRD